jgi:hypothetical protein
MDAHRMSNKTLLNAMKIAALVLLAMWITSVAANNMSERTYAKHEKRVLEFARRKEMQADSLQAVADSLRPLADSIITVQRVKTVYIRQAVELLTPPVTSGDTARDYIIAAQDSVIVGLNEAVDKMREAEAALRGALQRSDERGDSLQAHILRPKKKPSRLALAAFGGQCVGQNGTGPCMGVGLSWRIF